MLEQLIIGTVIIAINVLFHVGGLLLIWLLTSKRHMERHEGNYPFFKTMSIFSFGVLTTIGLHSVGIWSWGLLYVYLGEFDNIARAVYFSGSNVTTVGYGDIVLSEKWQILGTFQSMGGMLFFGISTAFFVAFVTRVFEKR